MKRTSQILSLALVVLAILLCAACGGASFVVLEVEGPYAVPDEVDSLRLEVRAEPTAAPLLQSISRLDPELAFPIDIGLEPGPDTPRDLLVRVVALRSGGPVAAGARDLTWKPNALTRVGMLLEPESQ